MAVDSLTDYTRIARPATLPMRLLGDYGKSPGRDPIIMRLVNPKI